jgi:Ca2+-binding RTX toxin-like protein
MTDYLVTGVQTTLPVGLGAFADGDSLLIAANSILHVPSLALFSAPTVHTVHLMVDGEVYASSVILNGSDLVEIGTNGRFTANLNSGGTAIDLGADGTSLLINQGTIAAGLRTAVGLTTTSSIHNSGAIYGSTGIAMSGTIDSEGNSLFNDGLIATRSTAVKMSTRSSIVENTGEIRSQTSNAVLVIGDFNPVNLGYVPTTQSVANTGTVRTFGATALLVNLGSAESEFLLDNSGLISGKVSALSSIGACSDIVRNSGTMTGDVSLSFGNDRFDGREGHVNGTIDMGAGNDTVDLRDAIITGPITGGTGADTYYMSDASMTIVEDAGADIDTVFATTNFRLAANLENLTLLDGPNSNGTGNLAANLLQGNAGDNRLSGLDGNDTINGDAGFDRLIGGAGTDSLTGDDGDDTVQGNAGTDTVRGGEGDDVLNGGAAKDLYVGNNGADVFQFSSLFHTSNTQTTADVISDFVVGDDIINLAAIDANRSNTGSNDTFTFIGTAAFTAAGQVRYVQSGGNTYIEMEVTSGSIADGMIKLTGLYTLNASDFNL